MVALPDQPFAQQEQEEELLPDSARNGVPALDPMSGHRVKGLSRKACAATTAVFALVLGLGLLAGVMVSGKHINIPVINNRGLQTSAGGKITVELTTPHGKLTNLALKELKCSALQERAIQHLTMHKYVPQSTRYCPECGAGFAGSCCFTFYQFGLSVPCRELENNTQTKLEVTIGMEVRLDRDIVVWLRSLPLSAEDRAKLIHILEAEYGIYRLSQMASTYPREIVKKMLLDDPALEHVLVSRLETQIALSAASIKNVTEVVVPGGGEQLGIQELMNMEGIFRGVQIKPGHAATNLGSVVTFRGSYFAMSNAALSNLIVTQPNVETQELVIAASSAEDANTMNSMMSSMGASGASSAAKSTAASASASGDGASGGAGHSSSSSNNGASSNSGTSGYLASTTADAKTYFMTKYFIQPQASLEISVAMLQASQDFQTALEMLSWEKSGYTVEDLFAEFGSHVCLSVELGGWWKISANYESETDQSQVTMSTITSAAISSAYSKSSSSSLSGGMKTGTGGGSAGLNHSKSSSSDSASASGGGSADAQAESKSDSHLSMKQEWKGGESHVSLTQWLASLAPEHNSEWKVVNRKLRGCVGVWQWALNPQVRESICSKYVTQYLTTLNIFDFSTGSSGSSAATNNPSLPAELPAGTYACNCNPATVGFTGPSTGGLNGIQCGGWTGGALWCWSAEEYCSNPYTVYVTDPAANAANKLCTTTVSQTWAEPAYAVTTTTVAPTPGPKTNTTNSTMVAMAQNSTARTASIHSLCSGAADIQSFMQKVDQLVAKTVEAETQAKINSCDANTGYHWSGSGLHGSCVDNQCTCGGKPGAVGPACPVNGQDVCLSTQQAKCSKAACTSAGWWFNGTGGTATTCVGATCTPSSTDLQRCCAPVTQGNDFLVEIEVTNGGTCNADVVISGASPSQSITWSGSYNPSNNGGSQIGVSDTNVEGFTPTKICITMTSCTVTINNDWTPSGITIYNGGISTSISPSNEVGCTFGAWQEFHSNTRSQCSSVSPCSSGQ